MISRTYDAEIVQKALLRYEDNFDIRADIWLLHDGNIALQSGEDIALFEDTAPGIYTGHYFFKSRGKDAYEVSVRMLDYMFKNHAEAIRGLTPVTHKGALYLTRRLGFKDYGEVSIDGNNYVIFVMTKSEYEENNG